MDNITHSLIGLAAGEACATALKKNRAPIWIASLLANNIPDIDVPIGNLLTSDPLSRLLLHRGYSHTLLLSPLQGLIVFLLAWCLYRKRKDFPARAVLFVSLLGPFLHILADSWNSYGVHPFWPLSNEWYYGDYVFIIEPWIWLILLPPLFFTASSRVVRAGFGGLAAGMLALAWFNDLVPALIAGLFTGFLAIYSLSLKKISSPGKRITAGIATLALMLGTFSFTSRSLAGRYASQGYELAVSPYPGNPFCWTAHKAGFVGENYQAMVMRLAPFPKIFPVKKCPIFFAPGTNAPLLRADQPLSDEVMVLGIFSAKRAELEKLSRECRANAFLRFARIPYWKPAGDGWMMGDLRFDRGGGRSFATVQIPGGGCPEYPSRWIGRFHPDRPL